MENWVFLGDSLTEGVGSERVSHVTELVKALRAELNGSTERTVVHHLRLRSVEPGTFDRFVKFNVAGYMNIDSEVEGGNALCIWNLACEGRTIETDFEWLPLISAIRPELVVIFRGSLESIIRPAMLQDGSWPMWIPRSWRSYASMDPRCYFSTSPLRRMKQTAVDSLKQRTRRSLLRNRPGRPLMQLELLEEHYDRLVTELARLDARILMLGLLPVGSISQTLLRTLNASIKHFTTLLKLEEPTSSIGLNSSRSMVTTSFSIAILSIQMPTARRSLLRFCDAISPTE